MNSKFRGTLLGVLVGDCCGAVFEGEVFDAGQRLVLKNFLRRLDSEQVTGPRLKFTDDTAMTKSVAKCLVNYDSSCYQKELAVNFVKEYFNSPTRGYGAGVTDLFFQLRRYKFEEFLEPATQQFNGRGSFGNGAAMRVSPVALFCLNKSEDFLIDLVKKTSVVTHSNVIGVNGAILQALAVRQNLKMESSDGLDVKNYVEKLLDQFKKIETGEDEHGIPEEKFFTKQLTEIQNLLGKQFPPSDEEVVNVLGHSVNALFSVPTALYCFLRNTQSSDGELNAFRRTLEYTISLGGDTDTIASMACALSGSYYSETNISESLIKRCESFEDILELADQLHGVASI